MALRGGRRLRRLILGLWLALFGVALLGGRASADNMSPPPPPEAPPPPPPEPPPPPPGCCNGGDSPGVVVFTPQVPPQASQPSRPAPPPPPPAGDFAANLPPAEPEPDPQIAMAADPPPIGDTVTNDPPPDLPGDSGNNDPEAALLFGAGAVIAAAPDPTKKKTCEQLLARHNKAHAVRERAQDRYNTEATNKSTAESKRDMEKSTLQSINQELAEAGADARRGNIAEIMARLEAQKGVVAAAEGEVATADTLMQKMQEKMGKALGIEASTGAEMARLGCAGVGVASADGGGGGGDYGDDGEFAV